MRHGKKINHLGRTASHRKAMLANMACSLIEHKRINTTVAKAKALKKYVEPLITKSKTDDTHNRRVVFSHLKNKYAVTELFREVAAKVGDRPGGYTRIIKTGTRLGDNAEMCMMELVDFNEMYQGQGAKEAKKTTRRSRRGAKKAGGESTAVAETPQKETTTTATDSQPASTTDEAPAQTAPEADASEEVVQTENQDKEPTADTEAKTEESKDSAKEKDSEGTTEKKE